MAVDFLQFLANLILAGLLIRFVEMKLGDNSDMKKALTFIY